MKRSGPIKRKTPMRRKKRYKPTRFQIAPKTLERNRGKKKRSARKQIREWIRWGPRRDHAAWIRQEPCAACQWTRGFTVSEAHHTVTQGAGGDARHLLPLCHICHREHHQGEHLEVRMWNREGPVPQIVAAWSYLEASPYGREVVTYVEQHRKTPNEPRLLPPEEYTS